MSNDVINERDILEDSQKELLEKLLMICDRNPNLDGRSPDHNKDFCAIKSKNGVQNIEPTRSFCLKVISLFKYSYEPVGDLFVLAEDKYKLVSRDVKVSCGDRYVVETGGCSTEECNFSGSRAFHDAIARAVTRGMKRSLEALIGLPFVNIIIKELFGTFQISDQNPRAKKTPPKKNEDITEVAKAVLDSSHQALQRAIANKEITQEDANLWFGKLLEVKGNFTMLCKVENTLNAFLEEKGMHV